MAAPDLSPTAWPESDHLQVVALAAQHARGSADRECSVALNLAVRDSFRDDPYRIDRSAPA
jgi:hypothetical protein